MDYWFCYNVTSGTITAQYLTTNTAMQAPSGQGLYGPFAQGGASAAVVMAYTYPQRYLIIGSTPALVEQPYWVVTPTESTTTAGEYSLAATLNNPPSTPPSTATFTVAGGTISATIASNQATATLQLHASVASQPVTVQVSASGTVSGSTTINSGTPAIGQQLIPATSSSPALVAPTGTGSRAYLRAFYLGLTPQTQVAILTEALQNLMITVGVTNRLLTEKILPMLQASSYTPLSLTSAETAAITNWTDTVQANMVAWSDLLDGSGTPIAPYSELQAQAPTVLSAMQGYAEAAATLPNLG